MRLFTDKKYINTAFVVALLILVSVNIVIYLNLKFRFANEELINNSLMVTQNAEELYSNLIEAETNRRGFLITGNEEFIELYHNAIINLDSSFQSLSTLISQTKLHGNVIDSLRILIRERKNIWEESIRLQKEKGVNFRVQKEHILKGKELTERIKKNITSVQLAQRDILEKNLAKTRQSANYSLINLVIGSSIAFILLIASVYFLNRNITLRKEYEKRLEDNRNRLYTILESIGDGVIVTNRLGEIEFLNKRAREVTGWSNEDSSGLLAEHVFQIFDEISGTVQENPVKKVIATGKNTGIYDNTLVKSRTGVFFPIDHIASPVHDGNGDLSGVVLVFRDISEKRKAEKELLERRKFIQKIADSVPSIIYIYSFRGPALSYVNYKVTDLLGYAPEDVVGAEVSDLYEYVHKDDIDDIKKNIDRHNKSSDEPVIYEYRIKNLKGEYRWFRSYEVVFTKDINGDPLEILGSTFDITEQKLHENELAEYRQHLESLVQMRTSELERTNRRLMDEISERKKAEEEIKEAEEKFRSLVENALIGIYILQGEKLVYVNPRYCEIFGYDHSEILGKEFDFIAIEECKASLRHNVDQILSGSIVHTDTSF
ncbi:MAG: PAS domain S-box protein [Ignavibacteria bacterium]|nr:PAS domain S-box protein [Ignavibacteria bacterium]